MYCINLKIRSKKGKKYIYCKFNKKEIKFEMCKDCENKEYKSVKRRNNTRRNDRAKATDISEEVKKAVFLRDGGKCVVCGNSYNVMPNAHYISRKNGGLGIEQNIVTLCTELTENKCHRKYDFGTKEERVEIEQKIENYLKSKYENWNKDSLVYKKGINKTTTQ